MAPAPSNVAWFVSGANRGIGLQLIEQVASQPNTTVFAGVRSPSKATELQQFAKEHSNVHIVKLESANEADAAAAASTVEKVSGGLDIVIANAGIASNFQKALETDISSLREHYEVNVAGPLVLFKALYPLLAKRQTKKFITVSSKAGILDQLIPVPLTVYGSSKTALNFVTRSIHKEHQEEGFIVFPLHPGTVDSDMGKAAAPVFGQVKFATSTEESARGMIDIITKTGPEGSGRFWSYDGTELPW
jgi:norsolorinic acid ketoreductase